jgi:beta-mannanase
MKFDDNLLALGVYDPECPSLLSPFQVWEDQLGMPIAIISWYQAWGSRYAKCHPEVIQSIQHQDRIPLITWEPWKLPETPQLALTPEVQPDFALARILEGIFDDYIKDWAGKLARCRRTIWLRPLHEMNGNWYPWGGTVNGNNPELFRQVWRHLHELFKAEGADNVVWIWCPYACSVPDTDSNSLENYFPGRDYVDWLALDGYNWGTSQAWSHWQSFGEIFTDAYGRLLTLDPGKPVIIAEIGCAESGGNKADWIRDAFKQISSHCKHIKAIVWFHINKECNWRLDSSPESLHAFKEQRELFPGKKI